VVLVSEEEMLRGDGPLGDRRAYCLPEAGPVVSAATAAFLKSKSEGKKNVVVARNRPAQNVRGRIAPSDSGLKRKGVESNARASRCVACCAATDTDSTRVADA